MILTFEKIREFQWNEKNSKNLQELPKNFFQDLKEYLNRAKDNNSRFVVEDLIDTRIRKIINFALNYFKTKELPKNLTSEEIKLFETILSQISNFRKDILEIKNLSEEEIVKNTSEKLYSEKRIKDSAEIKDLKLEFEDKVEKIDKVKSEKEIIVEKDIGPIVGPDLVVYNLKKGEKVRLPEDLKNLLIKYGYCKTEE